VSNRIYEFMLCYWLLVYTQYRYKRQRPRRSISQLCETETWRHIRHTLALSSSVSIKIHDLMAMSYLRRLVAGLPQRRLGFEPTSGHVGFMVDKVALGQVFSKYFGLPCQFSFHRLICAHHLSTGTDTIDQTETDVPSGLSLSPPQETKNYMI
jgi:hypothetical protein